MAAVSGCRVPLCCIGRAWGLSKPHSSGCCCRKTQARSGAKALGRVYCRRSRCYCPSSPDTGTMIRVAPQQGYQPSQLKGEAQSGGQGLTSSSSEAGDTGTGRQQGILSLLEDMLCRQCYVLGKHPGIHPVLPSIVQEITDFGDTSLRGNQGTSTPCATRWG